MEHLRRRPDSGAAGEVEMNCHGCKWLDEVGKKGAGYCCTVVRSKFYRTMPCTIDCGHRAPQIRRQQDDRCELYEAGDFKTRYEKEETDG